MDTFKIVNAIPVENDNYSGIRLTLEDAKGQVLRTKENGVSHINLTEREFNNLLRQKGIDVEKMNMTQFDVLNLANNAKLSAKIELKTKGEDYVVEYENQMVTTDGGKTWKEGKVGETYQVFETGHRINYGEDIALLLDASLARETVRAYQTA